MKNNRNIYVLGSGLSHNGSACLLKNGKVCVAIEKERITRTKNDGGNDSDAINYCLQAENISINDVSLVVQNANFGAFKNGNLHYKGVRIFKENINIPIVTISHHLAHAYYALGTSKFEEANIFVLDGCGNLYDECIDIYQGRITPENIVTEMQHLYAEKDSFYIYQNGELSTVRKDFSPWGMSVKGYNMHPGTTKDSIGGLYDAVARYCFGNLGSNTGKLMGLAPYGRPNTYNDEIFYFEGDRVFLDYSWMYKFNRPALTYRDFLKDFQYYADIAYWIQRETEKAILFLFRTRRKLAHTDRILYTGGVALNAVANALIMKERLYKDMEIPPAAGDNGIAVGCAFYGWLEVLKKEKVTHNGGAFFGKKYSEHEIQQSLDTFTIPDSKSNKDFLDVFFKSLPNFIIANKQDEVDYIIQFRFSDYKTYLIKISNGKLFEITQQMESPDCITTSNVRNFIELLNDPSLLTKYLAKNMITVFGNLEPFYKRISLSDLLKFISLQENDNKNCRVKYSLEKSVLKETAELLASGKVVGWFQDSCEFGPRALGHRSILSDPRSPDVQKFINSRIKFREDFRPFAPAVLEEDLSDYFDLEQQSPYMIIISQLKEKWKGKFPGVVHVDNSSRIQTVSREWNEKFYSLLLEFKKITAVPILLNTSFNSMGMPIVETPNQAIEYFYDCDLDCLIINDFIIQKS